MTDLNALLIFVKVIESGSFSAASRQLGMPVSSVSRKITDLENQLGVRLLERSTRNLRLTDIGADVLLKAKQGVELSNAIDSIVSDSHTEVKGQLRLSAPPNLADSLVVPLVTAFQSSYADVKVSINMTERYIDHITEDIDIVFRVGPLLDSALVARKLLSYRHRILASPDYLKQHTLPKDPIDLLTHRLLAFSNSAQETSWTFTKGQQQKTISFLPHLGINDFSGLTSALIHGAGIGEIPEIVSPHLLSEGKLVDVLSDWHLETMDISLVYLSNRHLPRLVRLFKEFAIDKTAELFPLLSTD